MRVTNLLTALAVSPLLIAASPIISKRQEHSPFSCASGTSFWLGDTATGLFTETQCGAGTICKDQGGGNPCVHPEGTGGAAAPSGDADTSTGTAGDTAGKEVDPAGGSAAGDTDTAGSTTGGEIGASSDGTAGTTDPGNGDTTAGSSTGSEAGAPSDGTAGASGTASGDTAGDTPAGGDVDSNTGTVPTGDSSAPDASASQATGGEAAADAPSASAIETAASSQETSLLDGPSDKQVVQPEDSQNGASGGNGAAGDVEYEVCEEGEEDCVCDAE